MKDVVTYCKSVQSLIGELLENNSKILSQDPDTEKYIINLTKTGVVYNGDKSLCLLRLDDKQYQEIDALENIEILGSFEDIKKDQEKLEKYESVYNLESTEIYDEELDTTTVIKPPFEFGSFA